MAATNTKPASFPTLPAELRHKIWLSMFEPRTLSLSMREHRAPLDASCTSLWIQTFDIQLGLQVDQIPDEDAGKNHSLNPQFVYLGQGVFRDATRIKPPPGPVALEVCKESREIALRHYELMFRGSLITRGRSKSLDAAFDASGWGLPHTWVNPNLDIIFLSCMSRDLTSSYAPVDIQMLFYRCPNEVEKLERVGVMSHNNDGGPILMIKTCTALKELVIYLTDRAAAIRPPEPQDEETFWDEKAASEGIAEFLAKKKEEHNDNLDPNYFTRYGSPWTTAVPQVRVSQEIHWYRDSERKLKLRLAPPTKYDDQMFRSP